MEGGISSITIFINPYGNQVSLEGNYLLATNYIFNSVIRALSLKSISLGLLIIF